MIGTVLTSTIEEGLIECTVDLGSDDTVTCTLYGLAGVDSYPLPGDEVHVTINDEEYTITAVFRDAQDGFGPGETVVYSRDSDGNIKATVKCTADGNVILNAGTRSAVGFEDLKTAFDQLRTDHDDLYGVVSAHGHLSGPPGAPTGPAIELPSQAPVIPVPSTADVDPAESETVKLP
jgi:hypothetical protein